MLDDMLRQALRSQTPMLWINPGVRTQPELFDPALIDQAEQRLKRAAPLLAAGHPALAACDGVVESPLLPADALRDAYSGQGQWLLKADHRLPLAGSVKARGGFHEVLEFAEHCAREHGWQGEDFRELGSAQWRACFSGYQLVVGSTGNLGISIGLMARLLGFAAQVHMSQDAKDWKKALLREQGVDVVEHGGDYAAAVAEGRRLAEADPQSHFVDDERSSSLFAGYAVAARRLLPQLRELAIEVSARRPLLVYLPCGVGGAPGGIAYGLKQMLGDAVHVWFAEPVASPSVLLQLAAGLEQPLSVYDIGLDNRTLADGMAVAQASMLASNAMQDRLAGVFTVSDAQLQRGLALAWNALGERLEHSACAGFTGPGWLMDSEPGRQWCLAQGVNPAQAVHLLWSTGGGLLPDSEFEAWLHQAQAELP